MDEDALRALMWQIEWGADEALDDVPRDRLATPPAPPRSPDPPAQRRPVSVAPLSRADAAERAAAAAAKAATLDELRAAIAGFEGSALRDTASGPILFEGDPAAGLLLIAGPPTAEDDRAGRLLAGPDGAFLDAMLASIGLSRPGLLATPMIPWRPPGGRAPSPSELAICAPFLNRLIVLARPRLAVLLGPLPARAVLGPERRGRGQIINAEVPGLDGKLACLPTAAPDQLLRNPDRRATAWADLRRLRRHLAGQHV
jgi:uracil-DNA glycosylase family 4